MPELPDVETFKRYFDSTSLHKEVEHVHVRDELLLENVSRQKVASIVSGRSFESTRRHGKYLGAHAEDGGWLLLHFGMTGRLQAFEDAEDEPEHTALLLEFADGSQLAYLNMRRFGKIGAAENFDEFIEGKELGPDALDIDLPAFEEIVAPRRGSIKSLLMNQKIVAGVGNVYADEILFHAGVRPDRAVPDLSGDEITDIHEWLMRVLKTAIDRGAKPSRMPRSWLLPRRESGVSCPKCDGEIESMKVNGRTTYFCAACQV